MMPTSTDTACLYPLQCRENFVKITLKNTMTEKLVLEPLLEVKVLELTKLLQLHGIPIEQFGVGEAKTIRHLAKEILEGETTLEVMRKIVGVQLQVECIVDGVKFQLVEDRQEFADGRERRRGLAGLSEKMKPGEDPVASAKRALAEELGIQDETKIESLGIREEIKTSPSYPGLTTKYLLFEMLTQLPESAFNPDGYVEHQEDKSTYFVWQEVQP